MFIASLCLTSEDLEQLEVRIPDAPCRVSVDTAMRSMVHQRLGNDEAFARRVHDLLDMRHVETVLFIRGLDPDGLREHVRDKAFRATGSELAAWAWGLVTDTRPEVIILGQAFMGECYVRGMRSLRADSTD